MLHRLLIPLLAVLILAAGAARADEAAKIARMLDAMRFADTLRGFPEALMEGMAGNPDGAALDVSEAMIETVARRHFAADVLAGDTARLMAGRMSGAEIDAAIAFYESDFGRRVAAYEAASAEPGVDKIAEAEGARLFREMEETGSARLTLIQRMKDATSVLDFGMTLVMNMSYAMVSAMYSGPGSPMVMTEEQIAALVNSQTAEVREFLAGVVDADAAYTYRDMSDAEFLRYVEFLESPDGRALSAALLRSMQVVMVERARAFGHDFRALLQTRRS